MRYCDAGGCTQKADRIGKFTDHSGMAKTVAACGEEHEAHLKLVFKLANIETIWKPFEFKGEKDEGV